MFTAIRRASSTEWRPSSLADSEKKPQQVSAGASFWVAKGGSNPQREYSLGNLCEDSVAQRRQEVGLLRPVHNEASSALLRQTTRREAAGHPCAGSAEKETSWAVRFLGITQRVPVAVVVMLTGEHFGFVMLVLDTTALTGKKDQQTMSLRSLPLQKRTLIGHQFVVSGYFVVRLPAGPKVDEAIRSAAWHYCRYPPPWSVEDTMRASLCETRLRKPHHGDPGHAKLARRQHQEQVLDDALKNTFPASDPVSIVQPARRARSERSRGVVTW
jgi:hypothetical protein